MAKVGQKFICLIIQKIFLNIKIIFVTAKHTILDDKKHAFVFCIVFFVSSKKWKLN